MNLLLSILGFIFVFSVTNGADISFDQNYKVTWGNDHVIPLNQGTQVQLFMDKSSGAGFESKLSYGSGFIHMRIKLPDKDSAGVVTAFYLTSKGDNHDELDFEFLGNREGKPITLQTNVFANGLGNREQRVSLWFDPTADFHDYKILWNEHQIVYFVDDIPIRVFKNNTKKGVSYPSHPMQVEVSLWDGSDWATDGGQTKINWAHAPFKAFFQGFDTNGCSIQQSSTNLSPCFSQNYWWNSEKYWKLDNAQQKAYENVKNKYLSYDYCNDKTRFSTIPPECPQ
ncbi:Xyloglucan endotransglucosylase/hydrolase [Euphorbia peplus]|nr:Xyloglucan endotransglucosylase/hydrolase [Euphorbia peplus]